MTFTGSGDDGPVTERDLAWAEEQDAADEFYETETRRTPFMRRLMRSDIERYDDELGKL